MATATLDLGNFATTLTVRDKPGAPARARLNVVWGTTQTVQERADDLLAQNGYTRTGDWTGGHDRFRADVEAGPSTGRCSCWQRNGLVVTRGYGCADHPDPRG